MEKARPQDITPALSELKISGKHKQDDPMYVPKYLQPQIERLPYFSPSKPDSVLTFLIALSKLNNIVPQHMTGIIHRLAIDPKHTYIQALLQESTRETLTYTMLYKAFLDRLLPQHTHAELVLKFLHRLQGPNKSFRNYVHNMYATQHVLKAYDDPMLIEIILTHTNETTDRYFTFQTKPETKEQLDALVACVEKPNTRQNRSAIKITPKLSKTPKTTPKQKPKPKSISKPPTPKATGNPV